MKPAQSADWEGAEGVYPPSDSVAFLDTFSVPERTGERSNGPGLRGCLGLTQAESLADTDTVPILKQLAGLISWAQAQQALVIHQIEIDLRRDIEESLGPMQDSLALTAAAAEVGSALNLPHMSAMALVAESNTLCTMNPSTHAQLSRGTISYRHAQRIMEEVQYVPERQAPEFEHELIQLAQGRTCAQFTAKARRLRESRWPETITARHRQALERRRVSLDPKPDGMAELSALVAAEKGQAIFNALTAAARTARTAGDSRTLDQLRTDVFTSVILNGKSSQYKPPFAEERPQQKGPAGRFEADRRQPSPNWTSSGTNTGQRRRFAGEDCGSVEDAASLEDAAGLEGAPPGVPPGVALDDDLSAIRPEIMILIEAGTLFGADNKPAELNGYGPISAEAARRLARQALHWTGLVQDSTSGEILAVGRRRKVPSGLKRWLQARDGTCRFPGCRVSTFRTEIDHTIPWSQGGATEHGNLENLCPKHHRLKSLGLWEARQPQPGTLEWVSPLGRRYRTEAQLEYPSASVTVPGAGSLANPLPNPLPNPLRGTRNRDTASGHPKPRSGGLDYQSSDDPLPDHVSQPPPDGPSHHQSSAQSHAPSRDTDLPPF